jgi:hypothetical protein
MKSFVLDGKRYRLRPELQTIATIISRRVAKLHIGVPVGELDLLVKDWFPLDTPPARLLNAQRLARMYHESNRSLYSYAMNGLRA